MISLRREFRHFRIGARFRWVMLPACVFCSGEHPRTCPPPHHPAHPLTRPPAAEGAALLVPGIILECAPRTRRRPQPVPRRLFWGSSSNMPPHPPPPPRQPRPAPLVLGIILEHVPHPPPPPRRPRPEPRRLFWGSSSIMPPHRPAAAAYIPCP